MEKVKYSIAIQTYIEVFDYLITNNLFVYDTGRDFLAARIKIGEYGFAEEVQIRRGVWDVKHPKEKIIPTIKVLKDLTDIIDDLLDKRDIPTSPDIKYAYFHDGKKGSKITYYSSYREMLNMLKSVYEKGKQTTEENQDDIDFSQLKHKQIRERFDNMTNLEKREIECYAKLEKEIINYTASLLLVDKDGKLVDSNYRRLFYDPTNPELRYTEKDIQVDWEEFKKCIADNYNYLKDTGKLNVQGSKAGDPDKIQTSELGLEGITR